MQRRVQSLDVFCLKVISQNRPAYTLTEEIIERAHKILPPDRADTAVLKQKLIDHLAATGRLTDDALPDNFFHSSLERVSFVNGKVSNSFLLKVCQKCPQLKYLGLQGCFKITDDGVKQFLSLCPGLEYLDVSNCRKLTDKTLEYMLELGPHLESIDIGGCFNMTVNGIEDFLERHENRSHFVKLHISGFPLTERTLKRIEDNCPELRSLAVGYTSFRDEALIKLLASHRALEGLHVHWSTATSDTLLRYIMDHCSSLQELNVCGVKRISEATLTSLIHAKMMEDPESDPTHIRKKLKMIDVKYTPMSKEAVELLRSLYPDLNINFK